MIPGRELSLQKTRQGEADLFERRAVSHRPREIWEALMLAALLLLPLDVGVRRLHLTREQLGEAREWLSSKLGPPKVEEAGTETAASHAQLKDARTRVKFGNESSDAGHDPATTPQRAASGNPVLKRRRSNRVMMRWW